MKKNILITGRPGVGKSTAIMKAAAGLGGMAEGFFTEEIREGGKRVGFRVSDLSGNEAVLSHVSIKRGPKVGKYVVDVRAFEEVALPAMERGIAGGKILIVDEIAKMELFSNAFKDKIIEALESDIKIIAAIHKKPHPFTDKIKSRKDVEIMTITEKNRDQVPDQIIKRITS